MDVETLTTLRRLREKATAGDLRAAHDWEWEEEPIEYVHLASDEKAHTAVFTNVNSDVRRIEQYDSEGGPRYRDRQGEANMAYLAQLWNAAPELFELAEEGLRAREAKAGEAENST